MAQALPLAKLATLLVKTLSKPVSKRVKKDFSRTETGKGILRSIGQATHSITSRMTVWSEGYSVRHIKPLKDEVALSKGADFMGETFVLMVSMGTVVWEYNRSAAKSAATSEKRRLKAKAEREALQANFEALDKRLKALEQVVEYNTNSYTNIRGMKYREPKHTQLVDLPEREDE